MKPRTFFLVLLGLLLTSILSRANSTTFAPPPSGQLYANDDEWTKAYIGATTDVLNATNGDEHAYLAWIASWVPKTEPSRPFDGSSWMRIADLDDDGAPEWIVSIPYLETPTIIRCEVGACQGLVVLFERRQRIFTPVHVFRSKWGMLDHPDIKEIGDINNDGKTEVVLSSSSCGAHSCVTNLSVGHWNGRDWEDLAADSIEQANTEITLTDRDGNGVKEITLYGGEVRSAGAGLQRKHRLVYRWQDRKYRLFDDIPDPDSNFYYLMLDSNAALAAGNLDRALELAQQAIHQPDRERYYDTVAERRIVSYAAIQGMLVYGLRHEPNAMRDLLREVESRYSRPDNPYAQAARDLWETFGRTGDVVAACMAVTQSARVNFEQAQFFQFYGYNTERLRLNQICPLNIGTNEEDKNIEL